MTDDLKRIYNVKHRKSDRRYLQEFSDRRESTYPMGVDQWKEHIDHLLTFMDDPELIWSVIYVTNWVERTIKAYRT